MSSTNIQIDSFISRLKKSFSGTITSTAMRKMGVEIIRLISKRTRLGKTFSRETYTTQLREIKTRQERLKPLSSSYVFYRKENDEYLSNLTTARKSNLTFTGQMLESLKVIRVGTGRLTVGVSNKRRLRALDPKHSKKQLTNRQVAEKVSNEGRPFMNLSGPEARQVERFYRRNFTDLLKRNKLLK